MLRNYLLIVIRKLVSDGVYTGIIVFGLAVGIAVSMIVAQYVHFETGFDRQYPDADRIFYTYMRWEQDGRAEDYECHPAVAPLIADRVHKVESTTRIVPCGMNRGAQWILKRARDGQEDDFGRTDHIYLVDENFFDFFSINLLRGDAATALNKPESIILARSVAERFFPDEGPLGKTVSIVEYEFEVTGVMDDSGPQSTLQFGAIAPMKFFNRFEDSANNLATIWTWPIFQTFIKLKPGADSHSVMLDCNTAAAVELDHLKSSYNIDERIQLHPFKTFHFYRPLNKRSSSPVAFSGDKRIIYFFTAIAVLILIISWANHINLTIARALHRAREVGLRKVSGASRRNLIAQFLLEFFIVNSFAFILGLTITQLTFNTFAAVIGSRANWMLWQLTEFWAICLLFIIISTIASGIYPAVVISGYNPIRVLRGTFANTQRGGLIRRALVVIQFCLASALLMSIYVIGKQLVFLQTRDLGMSAEQVIVVSLTDVDTRMDRDDMFERWRNYMHSRNNIIAMTAVSDFPGYQEPRDHLFHLKHHADNKMFFETNSITEGYFETIEAPLLYGRNFIDEDAADSSRVIINETAARMLGYSDPSTIVGEELEFSNEGLSYQIIGVVRNFSASMKEPNHGTLFHFRRARYTDPTFFMIRVAGNNLPRTLASIEKDWKHLFNNTPFDYFFLNEYFRKFYLQEQRFAGVFGFFSVIGILITCMGLLGLSMYDTGRRSKEIAIRKSLGGSSSGISWMFSRYYLKLVIVSGSVSIPLAAWSLNVWLDGYPNRIAFGADFIVAPFTAIVIIALGTVSSQTARAARQDPAPLLRSE
jgi:putative ABC transport system permease protein